MSRAILLFFAILLTAFTGRNDREAPHPFYVSVIKVRHAPDEDALQFTMKIFTDDLEKGLHDHGVDSVRIGTEYEHPKADTFIVRYLKKVFRIKVDGEKRVPQYLGKESEEQSTWCYLELKGVEDVQELHVTCTLLVDVFPTQSNIIHTEVAGQEKSARLNKERLEHTFHYGDNDQ